MDHGLSPRRRLSATRRLGGMLLVAALLLGALVPAAGAAVPRPDSPDAWFGPTLAADSDGLDAYAERLGASPSLVAVEVAYPLDDYARDVLARLAREAARQGAVVVVDARPTAPLGDLIADDAVALARTLGELEDERGAQFLVRFATEMNGSWETWGQQPAAYVEAFRTVADELHRRTGAGTVWAPVYGSGYPFRASDGADGALGEVLARDRTTLDTTGDGRLDSADDPYAPYYPGDEAVDWVGLSLYRLGQSQALRRNQELPEAELRLRLRERWGYGDERDRRPFVDRFASTGQPMLLETAAPYNPAVGGADEITVKRQWWRQLLGVVDDDPRIGGAAWLEVSRVEPEVADVEVDWRVTADPRIARSLLRDLRDSRVALGPVYDARGRDRGDVVAPAPDGPAPGAEPTLDEGDAAPGWWWLGGGLLLLTALVVARVRPTAVHSDTGTDTGDRDRRLDVVRGGVLVGSVAALVTTLGLGVGSLPGWLLVVAVGTLLVVSGAGHALTERSVAAVGGGPAAVSAHLKRAVVVYLAAVVVTVLHLLLDAVPGVESPFGSYADARLLLDYPPPGSAATDLLALRIAPGPVSLLGLFALLAVVAAPVALLVRRGGWWAALAASWLVLGVGLQTGARLEGFGWEAGWPVLVWQLPFVHGLVLAHLVKAHPGGAARWAPPALGVLGLAAVVWGGLRLTGAVSPSEPALLLGLASPVVLLAVVTLTWSPVRLALGWVAPFGRRPLLVMAPLVVAAVVAAAVS